MASIRAASTSYTPSVATASHVINKPAGVVDGDILVVVFSSPANPTNPSFTLPAGWSRLWERGNTDATTGSGFTSMCAWKVASSEPASWTFTGSLSNRPAAILFAIKGGSTLDLATANNVDGDFTSFGTPSITPAKPGGLVVAVMAAFAGAGGTNESFTPDAAFSEYADVDNTNNNACVEVATKTQTTPAAISATATAARSSAKSAGIFVVYPAEIDPSFIASVTQVFTPGVSHAFVAVPFIATATAVHPPTLGHKVDVPFIASVTAVYAPSAIRYAAHFVGESDVGAGPGGDALTINRPAGVVSGDLLIAAFTDLSGGDPVISLTGWTQILGIHNGSNNLAVLYKIATGSEPSSYTFTQSAGGTSRASVMLAYRSLVQEAVDAIGSSNSSAVGPTLTPSDQDDLEIHIVAAGSAGTLTPTAGFAQRAYPVAVVGQSLFAQDRVDYPSSAATGTITPGGGAGATPLNVHLLFRARPFQVQPPFVASVTAVYTPTLHRVLQTLPFIGSVTALHPPTLEALLQTLPFIGSVTALHTPTLTHAVGEIDVPFISSHTRTFGVFSLFNPDRTFVGRGNGGELFTVELAPAGTTETATLAAGISASDTLLELTGDSGLPTGEPFVLTIDDETLYVVQIAAGSYRVRLRGASNTTPAAHLAGADATWGDSYDQAIRAGVNVGHQFTADITGSGSTTYPGWLICFDSSQAYLGGDRYATHVAQVLGVFDAGAGSSGTNRLDGPQPNAVATAAGVTDDCPAALSNPARISGDITVGDVVLVRYTNTEAAPLDLGPRSVGLQSWFGMMRVDDTNHDVTLTDPAGHVIDTIPPAAFSGSVNGEWLNPSGPAIGPQTGLPTPNDAPYTSVTLPGTDRLFTRGAGAGGYDDTGWPICCLAVRQGNRRVPRWDSWDWHDFSYVYCGFGPDDTFAQILVNRNGILFGSVPEVALPGAQDIDGPDAVWDDGSYYFGASWYVALYNGPYLVAGPAIGAGTPPDLDTFPMPIVDFGGGPTSPTVTIPADTTPPVEGGSGGDISPTVTQLFQAAHV